MDEDKENFVSERECIGEEKVYFELYNKEINTLTTTDVDKADNYLHSYYYYQLDSAELTNTKWKLIEFTKKHIDLRSINSVVDVGTGSVETPILSQRSVYQAVDISEKVCEQLRDRQVLVSHSPASAFMSKTSAKFDLCFACDVLAHLNTNRLEVFLSNCRNKCTYITALIDTRDNLKSDILSQAQKVTSLNLHRTVQSHEKWVALFETYFDVKYEISDEWVYVFGKRK
jgi:trans-aconitate methyltransferase